MRRRNYFSLLFFLPAVCALLPFCRTSPTAESRQNYATYYNTEEKMLRPKYVLYNVTDSMSRLYFMISSSDLLYVKNNGEDSYSARIMVSYTVHPVEFSKIVIDSGHVVMNDVAKRGESKQLAGTIDMDVVGNNNYYLEVAFRDLNKATLSYSLIYLDHKGSASRNNFLATSKGTDVPLFRNYVDSGETFTLHYYKPGSAKIYGRYFANNSGPAPPPYAMDVQRGALPQPDSTWIVDIDRNPDITLKREGWYLFSTDLNAQTG